MSQQVNTILKFSGELKNLIKLYDITTRIGCTNDLYEYANRDNELSILLKIDNDAVISNENFASSLVYFIRDVIVTLIKMLHGLLINFVDYIKNLVLNLHLVEKKMNETKRKLYSSTKNTKDILDGISKETLTAIKFNDMISRLDEFKSLSKVMRNMELLKNDSSVYFTISDSELNNRDIFYHPITDFNDIKKITKDFKFVKPIISVDADTLFIDIEDKIMAITSNPFSLGYVDTDFNITLKKYDKFLREISIEYKANLVFQDKLTSIESELKKIKSRSDLADKMSSDNLSLLNAWISSTTSTINVITKLCTYNTQDINTINYILDIISSNT